MTNRWTILAVLFVARTAMGYQFQSVGSASPYLVEVLGIDYALLGTLIGLYMLPGIVVSLPGGALAARFGDKTIAIAGLSLMTAGGVVMALSDGYTLSAAGRLAGGTGAVLLNVVMTKMVTDWFVGREIVAAMALFVTSWPLGIGLSLVTLGAIVETWSLAAAMMAPAVACAVAGILVAASYRAPAVAGSPPPTRSPSARARISAREVRLVSLAGLIWTTYNVGYIIVVSFAPDQLAATGRSVAGAAMTVSIVTWVVTGCVPIAGYLAERLRRPTALMVLGFAGTAAAVLAVPYWDSPALLFVVMGVAFALPAGIIMALPGEVLRAPNRAVGMGIFYTWYYAGMAALPAAAGLARDWTQSAAAPVLFGAGVIALTMVWLAALRVGQRRG